MPPIWLIESGVYRDEIAPLLAEVRRQGMVAGVVPFGAIAKGTPVEIDGRVVPADACVIAYGTFPFARQVQLHYPWVPGAWCDPANLAGGGKLFVGRRVARDAFADILSPTRYDPATAVVIARPRPIRREWRLVVAGDRAIAGSQYAVDGGRAVAPGVPREVQAFAESMLADVRWRPDPIFMLDLCESADRLWLVELNGFSSSWIYQCDVREIVATVAALAERSRPERTRGG